MNHKNILKIISFDVDGTLVGLEYNDLIWFKEIPELVAKKKKISFEGSLKLVQDEYNKLGEHNLNWYDINYWISYFGLEISPDKYLFITVALLPDKPLAYSLISSCLFFLLFFISFNELL